MIPSGNQNISRADVHAALVVSIVRGPGRLALACSPGIDLTAELTATEADRSESSRASVYRRSGDGLLHGLWWTAVDGLIRTFQPMPLRDAEKPSRFRLGLIVVWSGSRDLNSGPLRPERSALPYCATPRYLRIAESGDSVSLFFLDMPNRAIGPCMLQCQSQCPERSALPYCATPRYFPNGREISDSVVRYCQSQCPEHSVLPYCATR